MNIPRDQVALEILLVVGTYKSDIRLVTGRRRELDTSCEVSLLLVIAHSSIELSSTSIIAILVREEEI